MPTQSSLVSPSSAAARVIVTMSRFAHTTQQMAAALPPLCLGERFRSRRSHRDRRSGSASACGLFWSRPRNTAPRNNLSMVWMLRRMRWSIARLETALPRPRLTGEVARTSNQLRLFANVAAEGSWVMARIDTADSGRTPPKPDIRSMLRPLGPVAVFGASKLPIAFSVAGGDTASALAAGNPVIVKAHPAHPGTSRLAGRVLTRAIQSCGFPAGTFSLLFDAGTRVGSSLVRHPLIRAVGFTGSFKGGAVRSWISLLRARSQFPSTPRWAAPIQSSSCRALRERGAWLRRRSARFVYARRRPILHQAGVRIFLEHTGSTVSREARTLTANDPGFALLSSAIAETYSKGLQERSMLQTAEGQRTNAGFAAQTALLETDYSAFAANPALPPGALWTLHIAHHQYES